MHMLFHVVAVLVFLFVIVFIGLWMFRVLMKLWKGERLPFVSWSGHTDLDGHTTFLQRSIRRISGKVQIQLILVFGVSVLAFLVATNVADHFLGTVIRSASVDYSMGLSQLTDDTQQIASEVENPSYRPTDYNNQPMSLKDAIDQQASGTNERICVLSQSGKVLLASPNVDQTRVNLPALIDEAANTADPYGYSGGSVVRIAPVTYQGQQDYVVVEGSPQANLVYTRENNPLSTVIGLAAFILTFYQLTKRKVRYLRELGEGLHEIAMGKLDFRVRRRGSDELATLAEDINHTAQALQQQLEAERLAEKTKNELITNVSHDLRTPLTLVMGYLRLLKDKKFENDAQYDEFVNIAYDKSEKLSSLIEDLFEYTKLTNQGVRFDCQDVSVNELLGQVVEEMVTVAEESEVELIREFTDERLVVQVDAHQMSRVFENLLNNGIQHCRKPGEVRVTLQREDGFAVITVANEADPIPADEMERLFERFYRGDPARSSRTGGSGLGLAIAKSIVELHHGSIHGESEGTEIRFIVKLPLVEQASVSATRRSA